MFKKVHKNYYYLSKTNDIHVICKQIQIKNLFSYCEETTPDPCKREKCNTSLYYLFLSASYKISKFKYFCIIKSKTFCLKMRP